MILQHFFTFLSLCLYHTVVRGEIYITSPVNSTWSTNSSHYITWITKDHQTLPSDRNISLTLMNGPQLNLFSILEISAQVPLGAGQFRWKIPGDLAMSETYVIKAGDGDQTSYSPYFTIQSQKTPDDELVTITSPSSGAWARNTDRNITWSIPSGAHPPPTIKLDLMSGDPSNLTLAKPIADNVNTTALWVPWKVPSDVLIGNYVVMATANQTQSYSSYFQITE